jgi:hypothetical protein
VNAYPPMGLAKSKRHIERIWIEELQHESM